DTFQFQGFARICAPVAHADIVRAFDQRPSYSGIVSSWDLFYLGEVLYNLLSHEVVQIPRGFIADHVADGPVQVITVLIQELSEQSFIVGASCPYSLQVLLEHANLIGGCIGREARTFALLQRACSEIVLKKRISERRLLFEQVYRVDIQRL